MYLVVFLELLNAQTTFYVMSSGSDSSSCGSQTSACASINQVLVNYPGISCTVSIGSGTFTTTPLAFQRDAFVIFQGVGNTIVATLWDSGTFITNTDTSNFEFHDLSIALSNGGNHNSFTVMGPSNSVGFYNVMLTLSAFTGNLININGGVLVFSNVSLLSGSINSYFIVDTSSDVVDTNVTFIRSTFSNLAITDMGTLFLLENLGTKIAVFDSSTFANITAAGAFIYFYTPNAVLILSVSNCLFSKINAVYDPLYMEAQFDSTITVINTAWITTSSGFIAGAMGIFPQKNEEINPNITLNNLTVTDCHGPETGGFFLTYDTLLLTNSTFSGNTGQYVYANDVVLSQKSGSHSYSFAGSCSTSAAPQAVIETSTGELIDISQLLDCSSNFNKSPYTKLGGNE